MSINQWKNYERGGDRTLVEFLLFSSFLGKILIWRMQQRVKSRIEVLDIGCGDGKLFDIIGQIPTLQYTGIDKQKISFKNKIKSLISAFSCRFIQADASGELPFLSSTFDITISNLVVNNFPNIQLHLQEIFKVLKIGGVYYISIINPQYIEDKLGKKFQIGEKFDYPLGKAGVKFEYYFLTSEYILKLAKESGFSDVEVEEIEVLGFDEILGDRYPRALKIPPFLFFSLHKTV